MSEQGKARAYAYRQWEIDLARRELRRGGAAVPLGSRAFEIIEVLVQAAGETVGKYDLMARVWPGAVVEENTLQFHISAVRKALGHDRGILKTEFGQGYRLLGEWTTREERVSPTEHALGRARVPEAQPLNSLPAAVFQLIGRVAAVKEIQDSFSAYRIVTLTGPGGVGKTKLALDVARKLQPNFSGQAVLVELASLSDPDLVSSAVATGLGLRSAGDRISPGSVAQSIGHQQLLLMLDNCEHLIHAAAEFTETVVRACPGVTVLATSREPLHIEGEHIYAVPPLDVPPPGLADSDALRYGAVQLFMARTAHSLRLSTEPEDITAIVAICRALDGIPLAVEFAAARAVTLGVPHVAANLNDRFHLLAGGRRTALRQHQTLRATLDWSYELLSDSERVLLRHLAVFPGGFSLEAATAAVGEQESDLGIEEGISNLVLKSLLVLAESVGHSRWRLLETVRAYAQDKLGENGETELAARRQAEFLRDLFAPPDHVPLVTLDDLPRYVRELDNVRSALDWAFAGGDEAVGVALTAAYAPVWLHLSLTAECRARIERALDSLKANKALDARLVLQLNITLAQALNVDRRSMPPEKTDSVLSKALAIADGLNDADALLQVLWITEVYRFHSGELRRAQLVAERFLEIARKVGDPFDVGGGHRLIGGVLHYAGDQREARSHLERALELSIAPRTRRHMIWNHYDQRVTVRTRLARVLWLQGHMVQANQVAQAARAEAQEKNHKLSICMALAEAVCPLALMAGDLQGTEQALATLMDLATQHDFATWKGISRGLEGKLLMARGEMAAGYSLLQLALDELTGAGLWLYQPAFAADLALGLAATAGPSNAIVAIDETISRAKLNGVSWYVPECLRIKGELLVHGSRKDEKSNAESCFLRSLELAQVQGALFWQLRTALSFARLRLSQDRPDDARKILAPVCDLFTDSFEFPDLRSAKEMLESPALADEPPTRSR